MIKKIFFILSLLTAFTMRPVHAGQTSAFVKAATLIKHGGFITTKNRTILDQFNSQALFIPASTWKIATASLAIHTLGLNYRFKTFFYQDSSGRLFIRGKGDPFLISEEISAILTNLKKKLKKPVSGIIIDDTAFLLDTRTDGSSSTLNPYDAGLNALSVNFNTINLQVINHGVTSAEEQTPYLPIMANLSKDLGTGHHRISLRNKQNIAIYAGQLFAALGGMQTNSPLFPIKQGKTPDDLTAIYINHNSKDLREVLKSLFLYSNNFIANQIFLTCGARRFGWPATWDKARRAMREFLALSVKLSSGTYKVMEGSGLSRQNMITPEAMLKLLYYFRPHAALLPIHHGMRMKSGTLTEVYSYAGYMGKAEDPFVLILNQPDNVREKVVKLLQKGWKSGDRGQGAGNPNIKTER